jgi:transglutaminase-like putative cysteine protease
MDVLAARLWRSWRPKEGWLPLLLLLVIAFTLITAVIEVEWVPEGNVVVWTTIGGLFLTVLLARRPLPASIAWALMISYGPAMTLIYLGRLLPPPRILNGGWTGTFIYIRQNLILGLDRAGGWLAAVSNGESSEETIVFAFGLGLGAWLLIAYAGWSTFRLHQPLTGMFMIGLGMALNGFYGGANVWFLAVFIGLAVLLITIIHLVDMEQTWERHKIDYPSEIKLELFLVGAGVAAALLALSFLLSAINIRTISEAFLNRPAVREAEQTLERVFAGVREVDQNLSGQELEGSGTGSSGLPRAFLLGNPPELAETVVMTATVQGDFSGADTQLPTDWRIHWRGFSYDIYTGRGWVASNERQEGFSTGESLPLPAVESPRTLSQSVHWLYGETTTRYTLGLPLRFDHPVTAYWRGLEDLSHVQGSHNPYTADSRIINATPDDLRQANLADVPGAVMARYTALPEELPERIRQLAQEAVAAANADGASGLGPYDQVKAIEQFLRQYPYSLDVALPPAGRDLVDYFLFDLQTGYCDYYASTMVVMARSLGIPARLATGFLAQPADENGVQTIYQLNAHSWAEVYFAGYGWVEFEPTAAFPAQSEGTVPIEQLPYIPLELPQSDFTAGPLAEPEAPTSRLLNRNFLVVLFLFLAAVGFLLWLSVGQTKRTGRDQVLWAYGRLLRSANRIGQPTPASQTPAEFGAAFKERVVSLGKQSSLFKRLTKKETTLPRQAVDLTENAVQLTDLFMSRQYSRPGIEEETERESETADALWRRIRLRLWLLGRFAFYLTAKSTKSTRKKR